MNVGIAHARDFNYKEELYLPIQNCKYLKKHQFFFPHEITQKNSNSREFYSNLDCIVAEVSYPAIGLGIELGWCYDSCVPIFCFIRKGKKVSHSIYSVTNLIIEYETIEELIIQIQKQLENLENKRRD